MLTTPLALFAGFCLALLLNMAGSQTWRDRLLFGGLGLTMLLHAFVLLGGRPAAPAVTVVDDMQQHGRKLQGLLGSSGGGVADTGLLKGLNVVSIIALGVQIFLCAAHSCRGKVCSLRSSLRAAF